MSLTPESALRKDELNATGVLMQHRHFAVVAGIIADLDDKGIRTHVAEHFCRALASTNPRFSVSRFLNACKLEPES